MSRLKLKTKTTTKIRRIKQQIKESFIRAKFLNHIYATSDGSSELSLKAAHLIAMFKSK